LDGAKEAYEVSFVAVPAQPRAGTTKNYCEEKTKEQEEQNIQETEKDKSVKNQKNNNDLSRELELRMKMLDSFIFTQNQEEKEGN